MGILGRHEYIDFRGKATYIPVILEKNWLSGCAPRVAPDHAPRHSNLLSACSPATLAVSEDYWYRQRSTWAEWLHLRSLTLGVMVFSTRSRCESQSFVSPTSLWVTTNPPNLHDGQGRLHRLSTRFQSDLLGSFSENVLLQPALNLFQVLGTVRQF